jgi:hypothetical protein
MEVIQRAAALALQVELHTKAASASSLDPSVGEQGLQADLDTTVILTA